MNTGVYKIHWEFCKYFYYGQSKDFNKRKRQHINSLKRGDHNNPILQKVFNKYGYPIIEIVEECCVDKLNEIEQKYLDIYFNDHFCCNILPCSSSPRGRVITSEMRTKLSNSHKGKKLSKEHRKKIGEGLKNAFKSGNRKSHFAGMTGIKNHFYGKKHTKETLEKLNGRVYECMLGGNNHKAKILVNIETGIFYETVKEAMASEFPRFPKLYEMITGKRKNTSKFIKA